MLVLATITKAEHGYKYGDIPSTGKQFLLATERINGVQASGTAGSTFFFSENLYSNRESPCYMVSSDITPAEMSTAADLTWEDNLLDLTICTDNLTTGAHIARKVNVNSIACAWAYEGDSDYSWLVYWLGGFSRKLVLVAAPLAAIKQSSDTSTTTTW